MKNMPIKRGKKRAVFKSQEEEEWLWTVYLSLVWWKRTYPPSATGLWFWAPTSNLPVGMNEPSQFPKLSAKWECTVHTQSSSAKSLKWEELCELLSSAVQGFLLGEISARIYRTPGMVTPVLWGFIRWGSSPDAKMGERRGGGCCVWVPTRQGTAVPALADYFPCGLVWEHLKENTQVLNVVLWDLMAAWAKGSICLGNTCINYIQGKMNK